MTVKRENHAEFNMPADQVVEGIQTVLARGGRSIRYDHPTFDKEAMSFKVVIKPRLWPLLLSTRFTITVKPVETATRVGVETCSQWFLVADQFHFYENYIADFLSSLDLTLKPSSIS